METQASQNNIPTAIETSQETIFSNFVDTAPYEKSLNNARIWLYVIAGIQTISAIVEYSTIDDKQVASIAGLIDICVAALFFGLALWSKKQPVAAFIIALVIYVAFGIGMLILNPSNLSVFYIIKVLVVIALVKAINSANTIKKLKESMGEQ